jgi:hypothetical protein
MTALPRVCLTTGGWRRRMPRSAMSPSDQTTPDVDERCGARPFLPEATESPRARTPRAAPLGHVPEGAQRPEGRREAACGCRPLGDEAAAVRAVERYKGSRVTESTRVGSMSSAPPDFHWALAVTVACQPS